VSTALLIAVAVAGSTSSPWPASSESASVSLMPESYPPFEEAVRPQ
jgi:hypothetical protein